MLIEKQKANYKKLTDIKFDLVIGNPPFVRGGNANYTNNVWTLEDKTVIIPNNQIALKFIANSYGFLKPNAIQCLIIKSSSLLYNSTSEKYKQFIFSNINVIQIFDFTALAETLWDNGARVGAAALFLRNEKPNFKRNILHATFKRTKATKERIVFEIDDYDLHFINHQTAIDNKAIWKFNLLGGGRIKSIIDKLSAIDKFEKFIENNKETLICGEGAGGGKSLPNEAFTVNRILPQFIDSEYVASFKTIKDKKVFSTPNFLIKENIELPTCLNSENIKFSNEIVGFHSENKTILNAMAEYFKNNHNILRFHTICTSGKMLVIKDTAMKMEDILNLPFHEDINLITLLSAFDNNVISDVNQYMQSLLRHGINSKAVKPIPSKELNLIIENYGNQFSSVLNLMYEENNKKFRLDEVVSIDDSSFIATVFKYDNDSNETVKYSTQLGLGLAGLTHHQVSQHLSSNRIIKLYPQKDTIVFVKPNQYRYWISLIAYRDADKCFADLSKAGY